MNMNLSYMKNVLLHIYEKQLELLQNNYIGPIKNTQTTQEVNEINTGIKPDKKR